MKVRSDFVSNSSSSSFVAWGFSITEEMIDVFKARLFPSNIERKCCGRDLDEGFDFCPKCGEHWSEEEVEMYDIEDKLQKETNLEIKLNSDYCSDFMGLHPNDIKDDETQAEFKKRIKEIVQKACPGIELGEISYVEEAWYDG